MPGFTKELTTALKSWLTAGESRSKLLSDHFRLISYCEQKLKMLIMSKVRPIVVFDGAKLEMKAGTEDSRDK